MLTRLLTYLCTASPLLRRMLWRWWYGKLAREISTADWTFMNYGFLSGSAESLQLDPADEKDRLCIQLYEEVVTPVSPKGKTVLEVGCGRGGGSSYIARYQQPAQVIGMDYSPDAIAFCNARHRGIPNLRFQIGDAEKLPFPDASFDLVVNVESSHCYGNVERFLAEVARVLRPDGHFVIADLRDPEGMAALQKMLAAQPWIRVDEADITQGVAAAMEADDLRKRTMIQQWVSPRLQPLFQEFAGIKGGEVFRGLQEKKLVYKRFAFRRK